MSLQYSMFVCMYANSLSYKGKRNKTQFTNIHQTSQPKSIKSIYLQTYVYD